MAAAPTTEVVANVAVAVSSSSAAAAAAADEAASTVAPSVIRSARLPLTRVKALVKADPDVSLASQEAIFVLARAAELFVETIAKDAYVYAQQGKRKTLQRKDLDNAIEAIDEFAFLEGNLQIKAYHGGVFKSRILLLQSKVVLWIELNKKESLAGKRELSRASIARGVK